MKLWSVLSHSPLQLQWQAPCRPNPDGFASKVTKGCLPWIKGERREGKEKAEKATREQQTTQRNRAQEEKPNRPPPQPGGKSGASLRLAFISSWHSYPEPYLHTATRQTRVPGRRRREIFASPIGTAAPNTIYTQQRGKPACPEDINAKFSHLRLTQLPRTQFTHSNAPNPHARKTSTKIFTPPLCAATLHTIYTQQRAKPTCQQDINTQFSHLRPLRAPTTNTIYTQQRAKPACQEDIRATFSHLLLAQLYPKRNFSKPPNPEARKTSTQNFRYAMSRQMKHYNFPIRNLDGTFYVQVHPFDPEYFAVKVHPTGALLFTPHHSQLTLLQHIIIQSPFLKRPVLFLSNIPKYWLEDDGTMCLHDSSMEISRHN